MAMAIILRRTPTVGQPCNGNTRRDVKHGESEASQQTQLRVGQAQIQFDRLLQNSQQLPINKIKGVHQRQQAQRIVATSLAMVGVRTVDDFGSVLSSRGVGCHLWAPLLVDNRLQSETSPAFETTNYSIVGVR